MRWNRSCTACRRRKIKCDRERPCGYCENLRLECAYIDPVPRSSKIRTRARSRTGVIDEDPRSRIDRLESLLTGLDSRLKHCETEMGKTSTAASSHQSQTVEQLFDSSLVRPQVPVTHNTQRSSEISTIALSQPSASTGLSPLEAQDTSGQRPLYPVSFDLIFPRSSHPNLHDIHPTKTHILALWRVFKDSVDPLIKLLHIPTVEPLLINAVDSLPNAPFHLQALMFSIYYSAATSMRYSVTPETLSFPERRERFLLYEQGVHEALKRANAISAPTMTTLQALTLYLTCAQYHGHFSYVYSMSGLLIRQGLKLGLHHIKNDSGAIEADIQRRLWGAIVVLDFEISLATNNDMFESSFFDVQLATFLEQMDIHETATMGVPMSTDVASGMLFTSSRLRIIKCIRDCTTGSGRREFNIGSSVDSGITQQLDMIVDEIEKRCHRSTSSVPPINHFTAVACRAMVARLKRGSLQRSPDSSSTFVEPDERLPGLGAEYDDLQQQLQTNPTYSRWAWIMDTRGIPEFKAPATE